MPSKIYLVGSDQTMKSSNHARRLSLRTGTRLAIVAAGATLVFMIGSTGGWDYAKRMFRIMWDGDQEGRAKARQLENVISARDFIDELSTEVEELEKLVEETTRSVGREAAQAEHAKLGKRLGKRVTDVLLHLDRVTGDDQVRTARRQQVDKALALGERVGNAIGENVV